MLRSDGRYEDSTAKGRGSRTPFKGAFSICLGTLPVLVLLAMFLIRQGDVAPATAALLQKHTAAQQGGMKELLDSLQALQEQLQKSGRPMGGSTSSVGLDELQVGIQELLGRLQALPQRLKETGMEGFRLQRDGLGTASLCTNLAAIFLKPPSLIHLPLSSHLEQQDPDDPGAFVSFKLKSNVTAAAPAARRSFAVYAYEKNDIVSQEILKASWWEDEHREGILQQLYDFAEGHQLEPADTYFIDVGANVGTFTLSAAVHGFQVIAFEPMFSNQQAIRLSLCANPGTEELVTVIGKGLAKSPTTCTLFSLRENTGNGLLRCGSDNAPDGLIARATVEVARMDDVLRSSFTKLKGRVGAVKIDVEGFEPLVIEGGLEFFQEVAPPYIVIECDDRMIEAATGHSAGRFLSKMSDLGYSVYDATWAELPASILASYKCGVTVTIYFKLKAAGKSRQKMKTNDDDGNAVHNWVEDLPGSEKHVYAQHGEDGVLEFIFSNIGTTNKYYVEFGTEDGSECITRNLRENGWKGLLMDGSNDNPEINLHKEFISPAAINDLFHKYDVPSEFDVLSIDVDFDDWWVWKAISDHYRPRVIVIEYNAGIPADKRWVVDPQDTKRWKPDSVGWVGNEYYGASILAMRDLGEQKGYTLVYCESTGVNAFFVRSDILEVQGVAAPPLSSLHVKRHYHARNTDTSRMWIVLDENGEEVDRVYKDLTEFFPEGCPDC